MVNQLNLGDFLTLTEPCPCCGGYQRRFLSNIGRGGQKIDTVMCVGCGLIHTNPIPTQVELKAFYNKQYRCSYKKAAEPPLKHILRYAPSALKRVKILKTYAQPDQSVLIDVGAGSGEFLYLAQKAGFNAQGLEPHTGYATYTNEILGLNVANQTLEQAGILPETVDMFNLNHVLEHMPQPLATLQLLNTCLKPNGLLLVDVPDIAICAHAPFTQFHYAHIHNFNHITLKVLLQKAGFEILNPESKTTDLIARKVDLPAYQPNHFNLKENYEFLWYKLSSHTVRKHYQTTRPYLRFLRKCYRYPLEFLYTMWYNNPKKILDKHFQRNYN